MGIENGIGLTPSEADKKTKRREKDRYFTPQAHAWAMVSKVFSLGHGPFSAIVEPSCGEGIFLAEIRELFQAHDADDVPLFGVDVEGSPKLDEVAKATGTRLFKGDWLVDAAELLAMTSGRTLVIGNPPFSQAQEHVETTLLHLREGDWLAFLLPLPFLATQARCRTLWSKRGLRYLAPFASRPSFTGDGGSAATDYAIYVWEKGFTGHAALLDPVFTSEEKP